MYPGSIQTIPGVRFLETYECERYIRYNKDLLFEDAGAQIRKRIEEL